MVIKNWRARRRPKYKNMDCGENRPIKMPPRRFPRTPPAEEAIQTNDWRLPEEDGWGCLVEEGVCLAISATMASFATSAIEAPRLLRRRYMEIAKIDMFVGEIAMTSHDSACKKAAKNRFREIF